MQTSDYTEKPRILVVEDEPLVRLIHSRFCIELGYEVDEAASGKEAFLLWERGKYAAILLDVSMPEITGLDVCKTIREVDKSDFIILCSAFSNLQDLLKECGADALLEKPFTIDQLRETLRC